MKRTALLKTIRTAAGAADLEYSTTEGANHTKVTVGTKTTTVGRHNEIADLMAEKIFKQLEVVLGEGWWR